MRKMIMLLSIVAMFGCGSSSNESSDTGSNTISETKSESSATGAQYIKDIFGITADKSTPKGLFYHVVESKNGKKVNVGEYAEFNFSQFKRDSFLGGSQTMGRPLTFKLPPPDQEGKLNLIIEAMKVMSEGDSINLFFPVDSFDRKRLPPFYAGEKYMRIDFKLDKILTQEAYDKIQEVEKQKQMEKLKKFQALEGEKKTFVQGIAKDYKAGKLKSKIKTTASGLKYIMHKEGTGDTPGFGANVSVNYFGVLTDGTAFDNSYGRGEPIKFPLGQGRVIKGWDEAITLLKKGGTATFFIPSELAYGAAGSPPKIPANSELIFYISLEDYSGGAKATQK